MTRKKRTYGDDSSVARALGIVGERWSLMIVRELLLGPKRFTDLRTGLPTLGADILTQRLRDLTAANLVAKRKLPPPAPAQVYELTPLGARLEAVVMALGDIGSYLPLPESCQMQMSFDAHLLTLRTLFDAERATDFDARVELVLEGGPPFLATVSGGQLTLEPGTHPSPDVKIAGDPGALISVAHGRLALADSGLQITGDVAAGERFLTLFPLPKPVSA